MTSDQNAIDDQSNFDGKSRRSLKNIIQKPKLQFRIGLYIMGAGLLVLLLVFSGVLFMLWNIMRDIAAMSDLGPEIQEAVHHAFTSAWVVFLIVIVAFVFISIALGVVLSHRFAGPIVPIRRMLLSLKEGDYTVSGHLRENDELREVMSDLNDLARALRERHGPGTPTDSLPNETKTAN